MDQVLKTGVVFSCPQMKMAPNALSRPKLPGVLMRKDGAKAVGVRIYLAESGVWFLERAPFQAHIGQIGELDAPGEAVGGDEVVVAKNGFVPAVPGKERC